jgi:hypothetical protein
VFFSLTPTVFNPSLQVWSREGWLSYFAVSGNPSPAKQEHEMLFRSGMIDFAGSGECAWVAWVWLA